MQIIRVSKLDGAELTPSTRFENSMAGPAEIVARVGIWSDDTRIQVSFEVHAPAFFDDSVTRGAFHRGLWKFDCGELWIANPQTGRYLEFNLAPNGAWWAMVFSGPRAEDPGCHPPASNSVGAITRDRWTATLTTNWAEIERCLGGVSGLTGNLTLVLGGSPDGDAPLKNFHSITNLGGVQPDFHRPGDWTPIEFIN